MINWPLIRNPYNWAIVMLMFAIGMVGVDIIDKYIIQKGA